jgi:hypothetical protein
MDEIGFRLLDICFSKVLFVVFTKEKSAVLEFYTAYTYNHMQNILIN